MIDSPLYEGDETFGRQARTSEVGREGLPSFRDMLDRMTRHMKDENGQARQAATSVPCGIADDLNHTALAEAIEAADLGFVLLTKSGFIVFANDMARELMRHGEGVCARSGWFSISNAALNAKLRTLLRCDASQARPQTLVIERGERRQPLLARVTPLDQRDGAWAEHAPAAVVVVIDPERYAAASLEAFCQRHGLTVAESRILQQVIGGEGLIAAAARLGVSQATARTHMQRIFEKTGTSRQTQLLSVFFKSTLGTPACGA